MCRIFFTFLEVLVNMWNLSLYLPVPKIFDSAQWMLCLWDLIIFYPARLTVFNVDLGFSAMNAVSVGFNNFLFHKTTPLFNVDLGFPELRVIDVFTTPRSAFQIQAAAFYSNMHYNDTDM